jgi:hypothetical protein
MFSDYVLATASGAELVFAMMITTTLFGLGLSMFGTYNLSIKVNECVPINYINCTAYRSAKYYVSKYYFNLLNNNITGILSTYGSCDFHDNIINTTVYCVNHDFYQEILRTNPNTDWTTFIIIVIGLIMIISGIIFACLYKFLKL